MSKEWPVGSYAIDVIGDANFVYSFAPDLEFDVVESEAEYLRVRSPFIGHFTCDPGDMLTELYERLLIIHEVVQKQGPFEEGHPFYGLQATRKLKSFKQTGALA
jgi:hypothetical protein